MRQGRPLKYDLRGIAIGMSLTVPRTAVTYLRQQVRNLRKQGFDLVLNDPGFGPTASVARFADMKPEAKREFPLTQRVASLREGEEFRFPAERIGYVRVLASNMRIERGWKMAVNYPGFGPYAICRRKHSDPLFD